MYKLEILNANTVFWNGNLGHSEEKEYEKGTYAIAEALSKNPNTTVVAGGDTVGFVKSHQLDKSINFISTVEGATLQFLAGEKLPGIEALNGNVNT